MIEEANPHRTVLLTEAVDALMVRPRSIVVDATVGGGGHAKAIYDMLDGSGVLIALDADAQTLLRAKERVGAKEGGAPAHFFCRNFRNITEVLRELGVEKVDAILADLGWNSEQFEKSGKGFSFKEEHADEPLLMTYGAPDSHLFSAGDIVNGWKEEDIANVLFGYGEERYARRITKAIVEARKEKSIGTVAALVGIIQGAVPKGYLHGRIHPATKTFQALRIAVNDELRSLETFLDAAVETLAADGRLAVITFHSIEDRIVKHALREHAAQGRGHIVTKKPITPSREELTRNPRARSAKLRIFEKTT